MGLAWDPPSARALARHEQDGQNDVALVAGDALSRRGAQEQVASGTRVVGIELAKMIVDVWLDGEYEDGRHQVRLDMLRDIEARQRR